MTLGISVDPLSSTAAVVAVRGELDVATAPELRSALRAVTEDTAVAFVVINLSELEFIDSTGLGVLIGCARRLRERGNGGEVRIACSRAHIVRVFEITSLDAVFPIFAGVADACAGLLEPLPRAP